jgi:RNA polymerase sigma-70 factor (ECF subfamily)
MLTDRRARFEEIYREYSGLILSYAARRTNVDDAADVVAETFAVAWRRLDDVPAGEEARPWLYGVARRVLANQRRGLERRRRLHDRLQAELTEAVVGDGSFVDDQPDLVLVAEALAQLSDGDRELLTLLAWDGLSRDDIAAMLECSPTTVRVRLHRARKRLVRRLAVLGVKRGAGAGHGSSRGAAALPDLEEA